MPPKKINIPVGYRLGLSLGKTNRQGYMAHGAVAMNLSRNAEIETSAINDPQVVTDKEIAAIDLILYRTDDDMFRCEPDLISKYGTAKQHESEAVGIAKKLYPHIPLNKHYLDVDDYLAYIDRYNLLNNQESRLIYIGAQ